MAQFNIYRLVYILFLAFATSDYAPNLKPYTERTLNDGKLCNPIGKKGGIDLSNERNAAVVVRRTNEYKTWQRSCAFRTKAPKGESLIVTIQNMYLRTDGTECLDYIKFKKKDGIFRKICGQIDRRSGLFSINVIHSIDGEGGRKNHSDEAGEFDPDGEILTSIHLNAAPLLVDEKLDLAIVYTPYKECRKITSYREDYQEIKVAGNYSICMWKEYFCDTIQNCVSVLCQDEEGCPPRMDYVSDGTGTKVTIGAVTSMLLCFIIFLMGLWICRKHKKFCWSSDCAGPNPHDERSPRAQREAEDVANPSVAVSPMLEFSVPSSVLDKDLPPSYDSLFPEQSNPSTT